MILVGASTGGTQALTDLFNNFPLKTPPILVVQHISPSFSTTFAKHLAERSGLKLGNPLEGTVLEDGSIYLSDGDFHIGVVKSKNGYKLTTSNVQISKHRPSVDFLFKSAVKFADKTLAILLTGMGSDGAQGMLSLKDNGAFTIAQDKKSSVVFGMPKEAIQLGGVGFMGNIQEIRVECERCLRMKT